MTLNAGYIEGTVNATLAVRIYYDATQPASDTQPLINGPRGWCLDVTNTSGSNKQVMISGLTGNPFTATIGQGNPVTSGAGRSRTAVQVAALGFTTRGSVGNFQIG
jgi:hypothetical protein